MATREGGAGAAGGCPGRIGRTRRPRHKPWEGNSTMPCASPMEARRSNASRAPQNGSSSTLQPVPWPQRSPAEDFAPALAERLALRGIAKDRPSENRTKIAENPKKRVGAVSHNGYYVNLLLNGETESPYPGPSEDAPRRVGRPRQVRPGSIPLDLLPFGKMTGRLPQGTSTCRAQFASDWLRLVGVYFLADLSWATS
jgi:hypothetical protein